MKDLRIVFMGTPAFAVPSLDILVEHRFSIAAVVTAPDKPRGRGRNLSFSAVKNYALQSGLPLLQPNDLKCPDFLDKLKKLNADVQVVVAFRVLPRVVWAVPALGTFNLHPSLLPDYRGAAPIPWTLINGEKQTGLTTFFIRQEVDTGDILFQEKEPVWDIDDAGTLHERLMYKGARLVLKTVKALARGDCEPRSQHALSSTKKAPKINKNICKINWARNTTEIFNFVRGLSPSPGAWTFIDGRFFKILKVSIDRIPVKKKPDKQFITDNKSYLKYRASDGWVSVEELQPAGKKRLTIDDFFRGNKIKDERL